jgi:predicted GH43/DUF377 family glycosyl hydrolase
MLFRRSSDNPILVPSDRWWEKRGVLNPGTAMVGNRVAMVYRAVGADGISRLGLAWSEDGVHFQREDLPFYEGALDDPEARLGVEDPRITPLDGRYYLTYTKVSLEPADHPPLVWEFAPFHLRSAVGVTDDFQRMREVGHILSNTTTKDSVLFPEQVDGKYAALVREYPGVQYTTSADLQEWSRPMSVMDPIPGTWEGERVGAGPPPVRIPWGWLLLYHANEFLLKADNRRLYRMGLAVLDANEPWKLRYRHPDPVFAPEAPYEIEGPVGNVVFGTGLVERDEEYWLYYGAGDGVIGVATAEKREVFAVIERGLSSVVGRA